MHSEQLCAAISVLAAGTLPDRIERLVAIDRAATLFIFADQGWE